MSELDWNKVEDEITKIHNAGTGIAETLEKRVGLTIRYIKSIVEKENAELKQQIEREIANNSLTLERLAITEEEYEEEIKELRKQIEDNK